MLIPIVYTCILLDVFQPSWNVVEGLQLCNVVRDYDSMCTAVVALRDGPKPLLACRVPYLELQ